MRILYCIPQLPVLQVILSRKKPHRDENVSHRVRVYSCSPPTFRINTVTNTQISNETKENVAPSNTVETSSNRKRCKINSPVTVPKKKSKFINGWKHATEDTCTVLTDKTNSLPVVVEDKLPERCDKIVAKEIVCPITKLTRFAIVIPKKIWDLHANNKVKNCCCTSEDEGKILTKPSKKKLRILKKLLSTKEKNLHAVYKNQEPNTSFVETSKTSNPFTENASKSIAINNNSEYIIPPVNNNHLLYQSELYSKPPTLCCSICKRNRDIKNATAPAQSPVLEPEKTPSSNTTIPKSNPVNLIKKKPDEQNSAPSIFGKAEIHESPLQSKSVKTYYKAKSKKSKKHKKPKQKLGEKERRRFSKSSSSRETNNNEINAQIQFEPEKTAKFSKPDRVVGTIFTGSKCNAMKRDTSPTPPLLKYLSLVKTSQLVNDMNQLSNSRRISLRKSIRKLQKMVKEKKSKSKATKSLESKILRKMRSTKSKSNNRANKKINVGSRKSAKYN